MRHGAAILTLSDRQHSGEREHDGSAAAIRELIADLPLDLVEYVVEPDDAPTIEAALRRLCAREDVGLVLTTGGTGLAPRDTTPDATLRVIEYVVPGIAEAMRLEGVKHTPMAMLSRAVAGVANRTLIINLPGSPRGVRESLGAVLAALPHALDKLAGDPDEPEPPPAADG